MEYYLAIKNSEIMPFAATWMDLEMITLDEVKSNRERQISYGITHVWNLIMIQMNSFIKPKQTYRSQNQTYQGRNMGGRDKLGVWD